MRIGLINELRGRPGGEVDPPSWDSISNRARLAEDVGFDSFVFEDALMYRGFGGEGETAGVWESVAIASALAATTSNIHIAHSVLNSPYRSPALVASIATTLDEISGGRYVLGIGAGNTPDSDYEGFGFPTDYRYSRFAEAIEVIHDLLKSGKTDFEGRFTFAKEAELVLRGPRPHGPLINVAAGGPKMMRLAARFADQWNWWGGAATIDELHQGLEQSLLELERACEEVGRDATTLERTFDFYSLVPPGGADRVGPSSGVVGTANELAELILSLRSLGFVEVRCDLASQDSWTIEAFADVVALVKAE